jgi:hypothetical protein
MFNILLEMLTPDKAMAEGIIIGIAAGIWLVVLLEILKGYGINVLV